MSKKALLIAILMFSAPLAGCTEEAGPANVLGCTSSDAVNYNANATMDDSSCDFDSDGDGVLDNLEVDGCTDEVANNHEPEATENDDSCDYDLDNDGVMDADEVEGCTNSTANNFDELVTEEDGSCDYDLDDDGILDADEVEGCTNSTANNFNEHVTDDDGSCDYDLDDDGVLDDDEVGGCTNSTANNYNGSATDDDGSCDYDLDDDGVLDAEEVDGCTDSAANNYNGSATDEDGSCDYDLDDDGVLDADEIGGCTDSVANNYDGSATDEDGSCDYDLDDDGVLDADEVEGCTDEDAVNHDPLATEEDGSCSYQVTIQSVMADFEQGEISYEEAFESLEDIRRCTESPYASNRPCDLVMAEWQYPDPGTIDPADSYDSTRGDYIENIFDTLFRYEANEQGVLFLEPRLALGFSLSEDGLTYTFELRQGVFFSNGDPMTSEDVRFSWCRTIDYGSPDSGVSWILDQNFDCDSIVTHNDTHLSVTLFQPFAGFPATLSYTVGSVINSELCIENKDWTWSEEWECNDWVANGPIGSGTGPFYLEEPFDNDRLSEGGGGVAHLLPNWLYWEDGNFNFNQIEVIEAYDWDERNTLFSTYQIDMSDVFIEQYCLNHTDPDSIESLPGFNCEYVETFTTTLAAMKVDRDDENGEHVLNHDCDGDGSDDCNAMSIPDVRLAISYSFDYEWHRNETYDGMLAPQFGPIPNGFLFDDTQYHVFSYNLSLAEEILEDAGFIRQYDCDSLTESGEPTVVEENDRDGDECRLPNVLRIIANPNSNRQDMAYRLADDLYYIGVAANGSALEWSDYLDANYGGNWDVKFSGWAPDYLDPDNYWTPFAASSDIGGDAYGTGYQNSELDEKIFDARIEANSSTRWDLYSDAFEIWSDDPNMIIVGQYNGIRLSHDYVELHPYSAVGSPHWFDISKTEVIEIALMHDQSGPISQFAPGFSSASWIAVDYVNSMQDDYRFVIVEYDTGCDGNIAAEAAQDVIDDGIGLVVGPMCSGASMGANSVLKSAGIPHISPASTSRWLAEEGEYPDFFRVVPFDGYEVLAIIEALVDSGGSDPLLVLSSNWVDDQRADYFLGEWLGMGNSQICGEITYDEEYDDPDDIAQWVIDEGCGEAVFFDWNWEEAGSTFNSAIVEAMVESGYSGAIFGGPQLGAPEWLESFQNQSNADGVIGLNWTHYSNDVYEWNDSSSPRGQEFSAACAADADCLSGIYTAHAFDAVLINAEASMLHHLLEQDEDASESYTLADSIRFIGHNWEGASGNITFDADGEIDPGIAICSIIHNSSSNVTSLDCSEEWVPSSFENLPTGGYYGFDVYSGQASTED